MRILDIIITRYILLLTYLDKITFDGFREMEHHFLLETPILIIFRYSLSQPPYY